MFFGKTLPCSLPRALIVTVTSGRKSKTPDSHPLKLRPDAIATRHAPVPRCNRGHPLLALVTAAPPYRTALFPSPTGVLAMQQRARRGVVSWPCVAWRVSGHKTHRAPSGPVCGVLLFYCVCALVRPGVWRRGSSSALLEEQAKRRGGWPGSGVLSVSRLGWFVAMGFLSLHA